MYVCMSKHGVSANQKIGHWGLMGISHIKIIQNTQFCKWFVKFYLNVQKKNTYIIG